MKEIIIVAGKRKIDVCWLRRCLREKGYHSIPCGSAGQIIEEMEILPTCDATVPLVIMEPEILKDANEGTINKLSNFALDVPFLLCNAEKAQAGWAERFDKICEYRTVFKQEQNPRLAEAMKESGIDVACG